MNLLQVALRSLQLLLLIIFTALIGNVIALASQGNATVNYSIFTAVWCWLAIVYGLVAGVLDSLYIPIAALAVDVLAVLFTFVNGVTLAAQLGAHSCSNDDYVNNNYLTAPTDDRSKRCRELQAATAFVWFLFVALIVSTVMGGLSWKSGGSSSRGGMRRGGPSMSQV